MTMMGTYEYDDDDDDIYHSESDVNMDDIYGIQEWIYLPLNRDDTQPLMQKIKVVFNRLLFE
jgi:hypothetical protein